MIHVDRRIKAESLGTDPIHVTCESCGAKPGESCSADPRKVLRDVLAFLARVKRCSKCVAPGDAYEQKIGSHPDHAQEWAALEKRMREASGAEKAAN